nr:MAG TPA: hypothetical protein [Caudoviricetes sp.]
MAPALYSSSPAQGSADVPQNVRTFLASSLLKNNSSGNI